MIGLNYWKQYFLPRSSLFCIQVRDFKDGTKYAVGNDSPVPL